VDYKHPKDALIEVRTPARPPKKLGGKLIHRQHLDPSSLTWRVDVSIGRYDVDFVAAWRDQPRSASWIFGIKVVRPSPELPRTGVASRAAAGWALAVLVSLILLTGWSRRKPTRIT
jgi:hypothetical protein